MIVFSGMQNYMFEGLPCRIQMRMASSDRAAVYYLQ